MNARFDAGHFALAELEALGLTFISLRDNLDLSTPSGRLMFQMIGAMAEFERALIQERVKAGLRNAKAKGVRLGRPRVFVSESRIAALRGAGASWRAIAKELGVSLGTLHRTAQGRAKKLHPEIGNVGMALRKSEHYSSLWSSCDELRGGMDASQYKDYVLVLLFIKYVSDKYAGVAYAPITIPSGSSFKDMVALKGKSDIGDQIKRKIIAPLANANKLSDMPDFSLK